MNRYAIIDYKQSGKKDFFLSRIVSLYFVLIVANYSLKTFFRTQPGIVSLINTMIMSILVFMMLMALRKARKYVGKIMISSYCIFGFLLLIGCLINSSNGFPNDLIIKENAVWTLGLWIPLGCAVCAIHNKEVLYKHLVYVSYIIDLFLALSFFTREVYTEYGQVSYNMSYGTYCVLPILLHINEFLKSKKKWILLVLFFELYTLLVYGNRGIWLSIAFYFFSNFILTNRNSEKKTVFIVVGVLAFTFMIIFGDIIFDYLVASGIESRTLSMFTSGEISLSAERDELRLITFDMIAESPIIGWGFGGEYYEIARRYGGMLYGVSAYFNPHNGVLQNLVEFGVFFGSLATFLILLPLFKTRTVVNGAHKDMLIIFGSCAVITKLVSSAGFFIHPEVAVFLYLYYFRNRFGKVDVS